MEETKRAIMKMGSYKTPGPDGFQVVFFKRTSHIVCDALYDFVKRVMEDGSVPAESAETTLVLIPKEEKPSNMRGLRPLSVCNVTSKLVSKIIVNRLKGCLKDLISPCQASFVPGR